MQDGRSAVNQSAQQIKDSCVGVALNGHMLSWMAKTDGQDGAFIKANRHPSGGNCFVLTTPDGKKLAGGNGGGGAAEALTKGLQKWNQLPEAERRLLPKGTAAVPPQAELCKPPAGGLVLKSYIRNLKWDDKGQLALIARGDLKDRTAFPDWNPIYIEPTRYNVWLTESEWRSLIPGEPKKGERFPVPEGVRLRLFRFHLVNGTFGLPGAWKKSNIRSGELNLIVEETAPLRLRLEGTVLLASDADLARAARGYDARLLGWIEYDGAKKAVTRFDLAVLGDYWGGDYEGGRFKRPGRTPLGIAFGLVRGTSAVDLAPPRVHMDRKEEYSRYFEAERRD